MSDVMIALRYAAYSQIGTLAGLQWFTPNEKFWSTLEAYKSINLVDAGCGVGNVTREAKKRGFIMTPVDMIRRKGQIKSVMHVDAVTLPYSKETWPLICRPDHSGWAYDCMARALSLGACAIYVGKEENIEQDVDDLESKISLRIEAVGEEEEVFLLLEPK
jgi:hypothetical protein